MWWKSRYTLPAKSRRRSFSMVQRTAEPVAPSSPEGGVVPGCDVTMKRDLKEIAVQLDNLNVPVMGFVFNFAKERKVSANGNYYYYYDEGGKKSQRSRKKSKHKN